MNSNRTLTNLVAVAAVTSLMGVACADKMGGFRPMGPGIKKAQIEQKTLLEEIEERLGTKVDTGSILDEAKTRLSLNLLGDDKVRINGLELALEVTGTENSNGTAEAVQVSGLIRGEKVLALEMDTRNETNTVSNSKGVFLNLKKSGEARTIGMNTESVESLEKLEISESPVFKGPEVKIDMKLSNDGKLLEVVAMVMESEAAACGSESAEDVDDAVCDGNSDLLAIVMVFAKSAGEVDPWPLVAISEGVNQRSLNGQMAEYEAMLAQQEADRLAEEEASNVCEPEDVTGECLPDEVSTDLDQSVADDSADDGAEVAAELPADEAAAEPATPAPTQAHDQVLDAQGRIVF